MSSLLNAVYLSLIWKVIVAFKSIRKRELMGKKKYTDVTSNLKAIQQFELSSCLCLYHLAKCIHLNGF